MQGAGRAFLLLIDGRRRLSRGDQVVQGFGDAFRFGPQGIIEDDILSAAGLSVENGTFVNVGGHHLFEAESLCAELHPVAVGGFGAPAFVFHGEGVVGVELNDIRLSNQAQLQGAQQNGILVADAIARFVFRAVDSGVVGATFGGETVLGPLLFQVDQRALARAVREVL